MKKFFGEFKKFIMRGNVLDMAVGVIVGGAFTGIVNGLSNFILKPIINWILALALGKEGLSGAITPLSMAYTEVVNDAGEVVQTYDLANSIYIDWGSFVSAILNFFIIAFVLFTIVKVMNKIKDENKSLTDKIEKNKLSKDEKKELKALGIKLTDWNAIKEWRKKKKEEKLAQEEAIKKAEEEKAIADRLANPTTEDLLKEIRDLLKSTK